jgi:hypothetical protein
MDKAIIINVFDFVNFHVCKTLLNKGIEVSSIHVDDSLKESFSDEKRLEIGRNANFEEQALVSWLNQDRDVIDTRVIISLYDLFMLYKDPMLNQENIKNQIITLMSRCKGVVVILPCQMVSTSRKSQVFKNLKDFFDLTLELKQNFQFFYLPTIYGPWQPETFLFQHTLLSNINRNGTFKGIREETSDAIYIDDAVGVMCEIIEAGEPGSYLLESGREKQWEMCAAYLNIDGDLIKNRETHKSNGEFITVAVKKAASISDSLNKQTEHTQQLYSSY